MALTEGIPKGLWQQLFDQFLRVGGGDASELVGHLGLSSLLLHPDPLKASGQEVGALWQHIAPENDIDVWTIICDSQATEESVVGGLL